VRKALVEDENAKVRIEAAKTLWVLTEDQQAVDTIISFLDDPSLDVRGYALGAFHEKEITREAGGKAVPILLNLVTHANRDVRLAAIFALHRVGNRDKVAAVLFKATQDSDKHIRQQASLLLRQLDAKSPVTR